MRASKPAGDVLNSDAPSPVNEVIMTMVSGEPDAAAAPAAVAPSVPATPTIPASSSSVARVNLPA